MSARASTARNRPNRRSRSVCPRRVGPVLPYRRREPPPRSARAPRRRRPLRPPNARARRRRRRRPPNARARGRRRRLRRRNVRRRLAARSSAKDIRPLRIARCRNRRTRRRASAARRVARQRRRRQRARRAAQDVPRPHARPPARAPGTRPEAMTKSPNQHAESRWSARVTRNSNALDLKKGVFTLGSPQAIARSLLRSALRSRRRKSGAYRSAMSMLTFYVNRAGSKLSATRRTTLERAKDALRALHANASAEPGNNARQGRRRRHSHSS